MDGHQRKREVRIAVTTINSLLHEGQRHMEHGDLNEALTCFEQVQHAGYGLKHIVLSDEPFPVEEFEASAR